MATLVVNGILIPFHKLNSALIAGENDGCFVALPAG